MKRLFSVFMLAAIATLTFAFTPKKAAFSNTYALIEGQWLETEGDCGDEGLTCQFTSSEPITDAGTFSSIQAYFDGNTLSSDVLTLDPDGAGSTYPSAIPVTINNVLRFE